MASFTERVKSVFTPQTPIADASLHLDRVLAEEYSHLFATRSFLEPSWLLEPEDIHDLDRLARYLCSPADPEGDARTGAPHVSVTEGPRLHLRAAIAEQLPADLRDELARLAADSGLVREDERERIRRRLADALNHAVLDAPDTTPARVPEKP